LLKLGVCYLLRISLLFTQKYIAKYRELKAELFFKEMITIV
jgi:hypothetical protein